MKKTMMIICGVFFLAGAVFGQAKQQEKKRKYPDLVKEALEKAREERKSGKRELSPWEKLKGIERAKFLSPVKGSRKIEINPVTPKDGIKTGLVIAYGHVIKPPYRVYYEGENLMINGVQVRPSLILERERKKKRKPEPHSKGHVSKATKIMNTLKKMYMEGLKTKSLYEVQDEITEFVLKSSDVYKNPRWLSDDVMEVRFTDPDIGFRINFSKTPPIKVDPELRKKWQKKRTKEIHESILKRTKGTLRGGHTIIFLSGGGRQGHHNDIRPKVNKIMTEKGLSEEERIDKLKDQIFLGSYESAFDVIENYNPEEWKVEK